MSEISKKLAVEFAHKIKEIKDSLPRKSNNQVCTELGLNSDGMNSMLAILSADVIEKILNGDLGMDSQGQMFSLGITLGIAYGIKLATDEKESVQ